MGIEPATDQMVVHGVDRSATHSTISRGGQGYKVLRGREGKTTCLVPTGSRFSVSMLLPPPSGRDSTVPWTYRGRNSAEEGLGTGGGR